MKDDFELVTSSRRETITPEYCGSNLPEKAAPFQLSPDHVFNIIELVGDIIEIQKIKVQTDAVKSLMAGKREQLKAEAEAYVQKKYADNRATIDKMEIVRSMLKDYYQYNAGKEVLSGEVFANIIADILRG